MLSSIFFSKLIISLFEDRNSIFELLVQSFECMCKCNF